MLAAGPDYLELIGDMSKSLDNFIIAQGNINEGFESFWDPISSASGGLLPSFNSDYDYNDLTTLPASSKRCPMHWRTEQV